MHDGRESEDHYGQDPGPPEVRAEGYREALKRIRECWHNYNPVVRWAQQVAANALKPGVFPAPGEPPQFDPKRAVEEAMVFHLWEHYACALSEARGMIRSPAAQNAINQVLYEVSAGIAVREGLRPREGATG